MAVSKHGRGAEQVSLRLPDGLRDRVKAAADKAGRSMNAEIVARLEESLYAETSEGTERDMKFVRRMIHETMDNVLGQLMESPDVLETMQKQRARSRQIAENDLAETQRLGRPQRERPGNISAKKQGKSPGKV